MPGEFGTLAYVGSLLTQLDGICRVRDISWSPGLGCTVEVDNGSDGTKEYIRLQGSSFEPFKEAELVIGREKLIVNSPDQLAHLEVLSSREQFWQRARSRVA